MKIKHTVTVNGMEREIEAYVYITAWDKDDNGRPVIEDMEIEQIDMEVGGITIYAEGDLEQAILEALDKDDDFLSKVYAEAYAEGEAAVLEQAIERAESAREARYEMGRGN